MKLRIRICVVLACAAAAIASAAHYPRTMETAYAARNFLSQLQEDAERRRMRRAGSGSGTEEDGTSAPFTLPGGLTLPTIPDDFTLPTLPSDFTLPTLPSTLPSITTPTLPGGSTLPPDATLPATLPEDLTIPPDFTLPTLPSTITTPTIPEGFTLPTLPDPFTVPPDLLENVTLPTIDLSNITLPPINLSTFTLPPLENVTLPPGFENLTFPPILTLPTIIPTALADLLTDLLQGNVPSLDSLISTALTTNVAGECANGWTQLFNQTVDGVSNGIRAVDAFGKLGAGYLRGNRYALGDYDECFSLPNTQYCLSDLIVKLNDNNLPDPKLFYAICLPKYCTVNDTERAISSINDQLEAFDLSVQVTSVSCEEETKAEYNAGTIIMILVWVLIGLTVVGATAFHVVMMILKKHRNTEATLEVNQGRLISDEDNTLTTTTTEDKKSKLSKFLLAFSLYTTVPSILSVERPESQKSGDITSLHGLKVLSLLWVILGQTHLWAFFFDSHTTHVYNNVIPRFSYQAILGSPFGFDSFFLLSGVLVTYVGLNKLSGSKSKKKYMKLIVEYLRRILHFSPVYAVVLFTYWLLTVHFADGPVWQRTIGVGSSLYENCQDNWWTNLFHINNFHPWASLDQCMPWAWYVASEFQFFIVAPLLIIPLALLYPLGLIITIVLLVGNIILLGALTGSYELNGSIFLDIDLTRPVVDEDVVIDGRNSIDDIHTKPWARVGPFLLGILLGFILFKKVKLSFRRPVNHVIYACLWLIAFCLCFATVYGTYGALNGEDTGNSGGGGGDVTNGEAIVYQMFSRITWAFGLSIVIFACHNGYGWVANDFLSMKIWTPFSRLSLLAYLIHPVVLFVLFYTRRSPIYGTDITLAVYTIATVVLSYGVAGFVAAFVDFPLRHLEDAAINFVGLGGKDKKDWKPSDAGDKQRAAEEGGVGHENIYFSELERAEEARMKGEGEDDEEDEVVPEKPSEL